MRRFFLTRVAGIQLLVKPKSLPIFVCWIVLASFSGLLSAQSEQTSATPSSPQTPAQQMPSQHSMGTRKNSVGLPNFGEVTPNLFRGGQPGVDGLKTLKDMGVSIVVDMRSGPNDHEKSAVTKLGMQYVSIPWHCPFPTDEPFARFLKIIEENHDKKVFVHCRLGDDRTGMAIASYRMADEGWSADEALNEMEEFGFDWKHHMICPALERFERSFPERLKKDEAFKDLKTISNQK
ncbi:MAG: tyrosine-protein phosphatase [Candidatus Sulfotelmatobacter sp.]